jgi:hypothetical protein
VKDALKGAPTRFGALLKPLLMLNNSPLLVPWLVELRNLATERNSPSASARQGIRVSAASARTKLRPLPKNRTSWFAAASQRSKAFTATGGGLCSFARKAGANDLYVAPPAKCSQMKKVASPPGKRRAEVNRPLTDPSSSLHNADEPPFAVSRSQGSCRGETARGRAV